MRKKCIYAHPWVRGSVGLKTRCNPPGRWIHRTVLPTKTSLICIQFASTSLSFLNAISHVSITVLVNFSFRLIFVAVTLLMVSLSFIAWYHLARISPSDSCFSCVTLSHLRTQIKYADSDSIIWKSLVCPPLCCSFYGCTGESQVLFRGFSWLGMLPF